MSVPDLRDIAITDFRSIRGTVHVNLGAPVVLLHGPNGTGKSTIISALELALSGDSSLLESAERQDLIHRGARQATVALTATDGEVRESRITAERIDADPLLAPGDRRFFRDRSYLQQRMLGQLLERYQESTQTGESALTDFVNDLLGLDELDALIEGLHTAGNVRRVPQLVPSFTGLKERTESWGEEIVELSATLDILREEHAVGGNDLTSILRDLDAPEGLVGDLEKTAAWIKKQEGADRGEHVTAVRLRQELDAVSARAAKLAGSLPGEAIAARESAVDQARAELGTWKGAHGDRLEATLDEARGVIPAMPALAGATDPAEVRSEAEDLVTTRLRDLEAALEADESAQHDLQGVDQTLESAQRRLTGIDEQLQNQSTATESDDLAQALGALIPHIHTESCPVCGRDYSEVGQEPLAARLANRIAELGVQAERLQQLAGARLEAVDEVRATTAKRIRIERALMESSKKTERRSEISRLREWRQRLTGSAADIAGGGALIRKATETERDLAAARESDRETDQIRASLMTIAKDLDEPSPKATAPLGDVVEKLDAVVTSRVAFLEQRANARGRASELVDEAERTRRKADRVEQEVQRLEEHVARGSAAIAELERRMMVARKLRREAQEVRGKIVTRVFTESLNRTWRDLFLRLAPEEPFVPKFIVPEGERIAARLTTEHVDGERGGSPSAMLSAGNLNTAALTLFLALNLTVEPVVPWIVLDDPVQSMDEIHVAQFSALLRSLTRDHKRRVIVAVHDRALYEYLLLELSPVGKDDAVAVAELTRTDDGSTSVATDYRFHVADRTFEHAE